jgi:tryptophan halogenase
MTRRYERIADFIKLHYYLTRRRDTAFCRDNTAPESAPDSLRAHLEMWRHRPPSPLDFCMDHETFAPANYQFVLYGMDFATDLRADAGRYNQRERAREEFARVQDAARRAVAALPTHHELLQRVNQAGFSFPDAVHEAARPVLMR